MLSKAFNWVKQNPDRSVPLALLLLIGFSLAAVFLVRAVSDRSRVPTPFEVSGPEKPAFQMGGVSIPRRALYGFAEATMREGFSNSRLPFGESALDKCKKIMNETPLDMQDRMTSFCSGEMQRAALEEERIAQAAFMLVEARRRGFKPNQTALKASVQAILLSLQKSTGTESPGAALRALGLTMDDIRLQAEMGLARDYFLTVRDKPTRAELLAQIKNHRELYARPAQAKVFFVLSPNEGAAQKTYNILSARAPLFSKEAVVAALRESRAPAALQADRWVSSSDVRPPLRKYLSGGSPGQVLKPTWGDGVWLIGVVGARRPAAPLPPFSEIKAKARRDWEVARREQQVKRVEKNLDKWLPVSYCEKGAVEGIKLACGRSDPQ